MKPTKKEFLKTQKEAFPNLNFKNQSKYFDLKLKNKEILTIDEKRQYAGHLCFGHHLMNPPFAKSVFIEELAIKKEFQGKGFGKLLVKQLEKYCKSKKIPMIYTATGDYKNNKSIKFYKKLGFKKIGKLKDINPKSEYKYGQIFFGKMIK